MKRRDQSHERRTQIIQAALACFTELGYAKTTMADIRHRSEASTGSIYHHFKSKEQLAAAVYLEGIRNYQEGLLEVLEQERRAKQGVFAIVRFHLNWVGENPAWARFLFQMRHAEFMAGTEETFQGLNRRFAAGLSAWVREQVRQKRFRPHSRDAFVSLLLGPCQEYARLWMAGQVITEASAAAEEIAGAIWKALRETGSEP